MPAVRPAHLRLTLTWDVLKRIKIRVLMHPLLINFNMGCIETLEDRFCINCIFRLTLTWDVLKPLFTLKKIVRHID